MTPGERSSGASSATVQWTSIDWESIESAVFRLQLRIAKAAREKRWGKVTALQRLLTRSYSAKLLAVTRVTQNKGRRTPGVDGVTWKTAKQKWESSMALSCHGYKSHPLRRIYIPKKNGKLRPLGIPTMFDRAMQALFLSAVEPVAEVTADVHSYGFRPKRSTADAIERCFVVLAKKTSAHWILEGDIKGCFDHISHDWMLTHLPLEKKILKQWLKAGFIENHQRHATISGTPQGGIISPCLSNLVLDGLEVMLKNMTKQPDKVHLIRYADDFVITSSSKELLVTKIKPAVTAFLQERGLSLSEEKTLITSMDQGFDFLGFNVRKYNNKLLIKPSKSSIKSFLTIIKEAIKLSVSTPTIQIIRSLNRKIEGWVNYYRSVVSKQAFSYVDSAIFRSLYRMLRKRHPRKSAKWIYRRYYTNRGMRRWLFHACYWNRDGERAALMLKLASDTPIRRHRQILSAATPYDIEHLEYFILRARKVKQGFSTTGSFYDGLMTA